MKEQTNYYEWLTGSNTGVSSKTIMMALLGAEYSGHDVPHDWGDFGRCYSMLKQFPELREDLFEVVNVHPYWMPFIDCWIWLESIYEDLLKAMERTDSDGKDAVKLISESLNDQIKTCVNISRYLKGLRYQNAPYHMERKQPINKFV